MKYKILFISSWFPNKLEPTNGNFVQRHAEAVSKIHHVEILHAIGDFDLKKKYVEKNDIVNGIRILIIYYRNSKNPVQNFYRRMKAYKMGFDQLHKPDLIHANILHNSMLFAVFLKHKFKIPFVVSEHWSALKERNQHKTPASTKRIAKFIGNYADKILPVSKNLQIGLEQLGINTLMKVIPNVVNTDLFSPGEKKKDGFTFIHVSNLTSNKNADKILNVVIKLLNEGYDFKLQIGGDGDISELKKMTEQENIKNSIDIFGMQTPTQVAERMRQSDCFILFSDDENQPCVIAEAFASGIKVISTNVGGVSEYFPEDFGILINKADEAELALAMIKILNDKRDEDRFAISQYAKETFSQEVIGEKFSAIYNEILK